MDVGDGVKPKKVKTIEKVVDKPEKVDEEVKQVTVVEPKKVKPVTVVEPEKVDEEVVEEQEQPKTEEEKKIENELTMTEEEFNQQSDVEKFNKYLSGYSPLYKQFRGSYSIVTYPWLLYLEKQHKNVCVLKNDRSEVLIYYNYTTRQSNDEIVRMSKGDDDENLLPFDKEHGLYYIYIGVKLINKKPKQHYELTPKEGYQKAYLPKVNNNEGLYLIRYKKKEKGLYSNNFNRLFDECERQNKRFSIGTLRITMGKDKHHANGLIYDSKTKTLTRFEPHGSDVKNLYDVSSSDKSLDKELEKFVERHPKIEHYKPPINFCPTIGPQSIQEKYFYQELKRKGYAEKNETGFCAAYSLLFLHYQLVHPDKSNKEIVELMNIEGVELQNQIRAYAASIMKVINESK